MRDYDKLARYKTHESNTYNHYLRSGRVIYRHSSNRGSVIEFNDGSPRKVIVLDSEYWTTQRFGNALASLPLTYNIDIKKCFSLLDRLSDTEINRLCSLTECYGKTSKQNCDVWVKFSDGCDFYDTVGLPAVEHCRSIMINNSGCDLPDIHTLIRIFCDMKIINSLDITFKRSCDLRLGYWSSTPYDNCCYELTSYGTVCGLHRHLRANVIPVQEIQ